MSIHINKSSLENLEDGECHLLPVTIEHDGEANVAQYFTTSIEKEGTGKKYIINIHERY